MVLMVFFSSKISPRASTVIFLERSPPATAVVTPAMLRTWLVRLPAIEFTESVRSYIGPPTPFTSACPPRSTLFPYATVFGSHACDFRGERVELIHHGIDGVLQLQNFPARVDRDLRGKVASGDSCGHAGDVTHLVSQVAGHRVHRIGEV